MAHLGRAALEPCVVMCVATASCAIQLLPLSHHDEHCWSRCRLGHAPGASVLCVARGIAVVASPVEPTTVWQLPQGGGGRGPVRSIPLDIGDATPTCAAVVAARDCPGACQPHVTNAAPRPDDSVVLQVGAQGVVAASPPVAVYLTLSCWCLQGDSAGVVLWAVPGRLSDSAGTAGAGTMLCELGEPVLQLLPVRGVDGDEQRTAGVVVLGAGGRLVVIRSDGARSEGTYALSSAWWWRHTAHDISV